MSKTLAQIRTAVYTRLEADASSPAYTAIHQNSIDQWANEATNQVILKLPSIHYQALVVKDHSLTFASGKAALPSDFVKHEAVRIGSNTRDVHVYDTAKEFSLWDSRNFALTPRDEFPVGFIGDEYVWAKQESSFTTGQLDYIQTHPTITTSQNTVFDSVADELLIDMVVARAKEFLNTMD